jgi:hypothetical protein
MRNKFNFGLHHLTVIIIMSASLGVHIEISEVSQRWFTANEPCQNQPTNKETNQLINRLTNSMEQSSS